MAEPTPIAEIIKTRSRNTETSYERKTYRQIQEQACMAYNNLEGVLDDGFDCAVCKNKGYVQYVSASDEIITKFCECHNKRQIMRSMRRSGLTGLLPKCTFEKYQTPEKWQQDIKIAAENFSKDSGARCFYIGGQSGCGKTHICTAICGKYIKQNKAVKYVLWRELTTKLKAVMNEPKYLEIMESYRKVDVIYIDDFLKTPDNQRPGAADINIALELVNQTYHREGKKLIISTEFNIPQVLAMDEALGGRICELTSSQYRIDIAKDQHKNFRLKV